jgi:hypothetical protein
MWNAAKSWKRRALRRKLSSTVSKSTPLSTLGVTRISTYSRSYGQWSTSGQQSAAAHIAPFAWVINRKDVRTEAAFSGLLKSLHEAEVTYVHVGDGTTNDPEICPISRWG